MDLLSGFGALDLVVALGVALIVLWFVLSTANKNVTSARSGGLRSRPASGESLGGIVGGIVGAPSRTVLEGLLKRPPGQTNPKAFDLSEHGSYGVVRVPRRPAGCAALFLLIWLTGWSIGILFVVGMLLDLLAGAGDQPFDYFMALFMLVWLSGALFGFFLGGVALLSIAYVSYAERILVAGTHGLTFYARLGVLHRRVDVAHEDLRLAVAGARWLRIIGAPKDLVFMTSGKEQAQSLADFILRHTELDESRLSHGPFPRRGITGGAYIGTDTLGGLAPDGGDGRNGGDFGGGDFGGGGGGGDGGGG